MDEQNISPVTAFPQFMDRVKEQLLESDLADSMLAGTGLRPGIKHATETLQGTPLLVQIVRITEIGVSAFQLEQTRAAREERIRAGVGNIEGEEDGDVEVEGEGPMPKYPRGTLRFELTDGKTFIDAMEYRPLPQLTLGITELGYKVSLVLLTCRVTGIQRPLDATQRHADTQWNGVPRTSHRYPSGG